MIVSLNIREITRISALLLIIVSISMIFPFFVALIQGNMKTAHAFLAPMLATMILCSIVVYLLPSKSRAFGPREGFLMVSVGWLLVSVLGAIPYILSGVLPSFTDAYFETMSGFTTTGASVFTDVEILPDAILLWRALTHWLGGMGVIGLTVAILPFVGVSGMQLLRAETPGHEVDKLTPKLTENAKILWIIYTGFTGLQIILLLLGGMSLLDAVAHSFATMATGGFSTKNLSIGYYNSHYISWVSSIFMILAGANFVLYFRLFSGRVGSVLRNSEFKAYLAIIGFTSAIIALSLFFTTGQDIFSSITHALFNTASIMTTTGYMSQDFGLWPPLGQTALLFVMFIGGSTGSTGGGIKVLRIVILAKLAIHETRYMLHPRGVFSLRLNSQPVLKNLVYPVASFVALYVGIILVATMIISIDGHDVVTSLTAALATLGNIGPGLGKVGPSNNFAFFSDGMTWFFSFLMFIGRLELYTVLVLFVPWFWKRS